MKKDKVKDNEYQLVSMLKETHNLFWELADAEGMMLYMYLKRLAEREFKKKFKK